MTKVRNPLPIIPHRPADEPLTCLKINKHWVPALIGMVQRYQHPEFFLGTLEENRQARLDVGELLDILSEAEGCDMANDCNCVVTVIVLHRIDPITLQLQISIDNGETWQPDPNSVIGSLIEQPPPVTSGITANSCDAATNGKQHLVDWIAGVGNTFDTVATVFEFGVQVILLVANLILWYATAGTLTLQQIAELEALGAFLHQVFEEGKTLWDSYWTSDETDKLLCALVCNISDDGSFTEAGFAGVINDLRATLTPAAQGWLLITMLGQNGRVGLNNMCSYGSTADADCSSCECECDWTNWLAATATEAEPATGTDINGDYLQWTAVLTALSDYRVDISNDGFWASHNYSDACCTPGDGRFRTFEVGTETPKVITGIFGYACGDNDLGHYGAANNAAWWGAEALATNEDGAFDLRLYLHV